MQLGREGLERARNFAEGKKTLFSTVSFHHFAPRHNFNYAIDHAKWQNQPFQTLIDGR